MCWAALDGPSGKTLRPALPAVVANLRANGHLQVSADVAAALATMSAATDIDAIAATLNSCC